MSMWVVPGKKDAVSVFLAEKLIESTRCPEIRDEASFYRVGEEVPYIAGILVTSFSYHLVIPSSSEDWLEEVQDITEPILDRLHPVRAQQLGDKMLLSLFSMGRYPALHRPEDTEAIGQELYKLASLLHPEEELRPTFEVLSLNFPVWARALPRAAKTISLVL